MVVRHGVAVTEESTQGTCSVTTKYGYVRMLVSLVCSIRGNWQNTVGNVEKQHAYRDLQKRGDEYEQCKEQYKEQVTEKLEHLASQGPYAG